MQPSSSEIWIDSGIKIDVVHPSFTIASTVTAESLCPTCSLVGVQTDRGPATRSARPRVGPPQCAHSGVHLDRIGCVISETSGQSSPFVAGTRNSRAGEHAATKFLLELTG